ncbi:hypothetical protein [Reyranella massiliensis]|uniref:hypothetical protein n=1 Tax=Reyranella massiliensis TaxID=445220 RepID=UPI0005C29CB6|nr:hypothetical protein [Reyranella massiliensis]
MGNRRALLLSQTMCARRSAVTSRVPSRRNRRHNPRQSLAESIDRRIAELRAWLEENAPDTTEMQSHLDANTSERAYWHHGYLVALIDMRDLLRERKDPPA